MVVKPLGRKKRRPVALLVPGHRQLTVVDATGRKAASGTRQVSKLLEALRGTCTYVTGALTGLRHCTPVSEWSCRTWKGKATAMVHEPSGTTVTSLRGCAEGLTPEAAFDELARVLDRCAEYGVQPGSISGMAWDLWRASLGNRVTLGTDPSTVGPAFFGGRQGAKDPGMYRHMSSFDLRSAYPHSMAARPFAAGLHQVDPTSELDPTVSGFARATVLVPSDSAFPPLPLRLAPAVIMFPTGPITGTWAWCELDAAKQLGCDVRVHESYAPTREVDLFGTWWEIARMGRRDLDGAAEDIWKSLCNAVWGQFAMDGSQRGTRRWESVSVYDPSKGRKKRTEVAIDTALPVRHLPHEWTRHVAAETTARVRRRTLLEGLCGVPFAPVHVDTDGMIVRRSSPHPEPWGDAPGEWRLKAEIRDLDLRAPQLFRWTCAGCLHGEHARWHYVASGVPASSAEYVFEHGLQTRVSYRSAFDVNIPSCHVDSTDEVDRWLTEARALAGVL